MAQGSGRGPIGGGAGAVAHLAAIRDGLAVLPADRWRTVTAPPLGRAGDAVALVIGPPGVFVVHAAHGSRHLQMKLAADERRTSDPIRAVRRQVRSARSRLSSALERIVVVRGVLVLPAGTVIDADDRLVQVVIPEGLPAALLCCRGEVLTPGEVAALERAALDQRTWHSTRRRWWDAARQLATGTVE